MPQVKLREKGQVTIPADLLQEWGRKNQVTTNDSIQVSLSNGVLMLIPSKRHAAKRDVMSYAGIGKGMWGGSHEEVEATVRELRSSWTR
jgi:antitoxin component of MazEF toxin-antitoxin module